MPNCTQKKQQPKKPQPTARLNSPHVSVGFTLTSCELHQECSWLLLPWLVMWVHIMGVLLKTIKQVWWVLIRTPTISHSWFGKTKLKKTWKKILTKITGRISHFILDLQLARPPEQCAGPEWVFADWCKYKNSSLLGRLLTSHHSSLSRCPWRNVTSGQNGFLEGQWTSSFY